MLYTNHANALQSFDVHNATSCDATKALRSCDASHRSPRSHLLLSDCGSGCHRLLSNPDPTTMQSTSPHCTPVCEIPDFFWSVGIGSGQHNFRRYRRSQQILKGYRQAYKHNFLATKMPQLRIMAKYAKFSIWGAYLGAPNMLKWGCP